MNQPTFGDELRRLRQQRGLSLKKFAQLVHYDPGYLSKIENGLKPPTDAIVGRCDAVLEADGALAALVGIRGAPGQQHPRYSGNPRRPDLFTLWEPDVVAGHALQLPGYDLALSRRDVLVSGTTVLAGAALVDPLQNCLFPSVSDSGHELRGLSEDEVVAMEAGVRYLRVWARQRGGGMARKTAAAQSKDLRDRLQSVRSGVLRDRAFLDDLFQGVGQWS